MDERTDSELVALARAGNKDAFGIVAERYQDLARRLAIGMVRHDEVARDMAQEAVLQAYLSLDRLRDQTRFGSWLCGIVLNVCRSYLRERRPNLSLEAMAGGTRFEEATFSSAGPDPQEVAEERELHRLVIGAVNSLSPENRSAAVLFYWQQLTVREIAALLDISPVAVKGRLHRSRNVLRERLSALGVETSRPVQAGRRRNDMVKVTIADVVQQRLPEGEEEGGLARWVVVLLDEAGRRALPIWIGQSEGSAIAMGLRGSPWPRPMTFSFMASLLDAAGATIEKVQIEAIRETTFYATVKVRASGGVREVDARPSDALALAAHAEAPIYVADDVLATAGKDIPANGREAERLGTGIDSMMREIESRRGQEHEALAHRPSEEEIERNIRALMAQVFG